MNRIIALLLCVVISFGIGTESDGTLSLPAVGNAVPSGQRGTLSLLSVGNAVPSGQRGTLSLMSVTADYYSNTQWALENTGEYTFIGNRSTKVKSSVKDIDLDVPDAWAYYLSSPASRIPVIVAIIDSGVDSEHPDLVNAMWTNPGEIPGNGIDDDKNGYIDDIHGWDFYNDDSDICHYEYNKELKKNLADPNDCDDHGTHCAGIIAAELNNDIGIAGVASIGNIQIMSLKIHGGTSLSGSVSNAVKAISYAEMMGAKVCNISWGSYTYSSALYDAMKHSDMLFVCAAGNDGNDNDYRPLYPACFDLPNVLSVTQMNATGKLPVSANYGGDSVMIAAPGADIFSTIVGDYATLSGSSMAAPHVSAMAALAFSTVHGLSPVDVKEAIISSLKPNDSLDSLVKYPGTPSVYGTIKAILDVAPDLTAPDFTLHRSFNQNNIIIDFETSDEGGSGVCGIRWLFGRQQESTFKNKSAGTFIDGNRLSVQKPGYYTFCIYDCSGNCTYKTYYITDDLVAPEIDDISMKPSKNGKTFTISAHVSDSQSGISKVKLLPGIHTGSDFKSAKIPQLELDGNNYFRTNVTEPGAYTIYAVDYRGNVTLKVIRAYTRVSRSLTLKRSSKTLDKGNTYRIRSVIEPASTTDTLSYKSSDTGIATVASDGTVTAVSTGSALITVTTSGGLSTVFNIIVR